MAWPSGRRLKAWLWHELPRSLIIALAAIHILSLATILYYGRAALQDAREQVAVHMAGRWISELAHALAATDQSTPQLCDQLQRFNHGGAWHSLRVVTADGQIIASIRDTEIKTRHLQTDSLARSWPTSLHLHHEQPPSGIHSVTYRTPVPPHDDAAANLMLEGVVSPAGLVLQAPSSFRSLWIIAAVSALAILVVCWLLRRGLRSLGSIGSNLVRHRQRLQEQLSSLKLASEADAVSQAWNRLIELVENMRDLAGRSTVSDELSAAVRDSHAAAFLGALDDLPEGIIHVLAHQRLGYANRQACSLLGIDAAVWENQHPVLDDVKTSELGCHIIDAIHSARRESHYESRTAIIDAPQGAYQVRILPLQSCRGTAAVVRVVDASQRLRAEKAREEFVAQTAHELRTPLANIQAYAETYGEFDDPQIRMECFNVITKEARRLARLVEEMLCRSQLDVGSITISPDDVDLAALLTESVRDLKATAESRGLELSLHLPSKTPKLVGDRDKLAVVINNLLGNAVKYTDSGGKVAVSCEADHQQVTIEIRDTGIGIAGDEQPKIFNRGYRACSTKVDQQPGSGLGLTTALQIVQAHGGDIRLQSKLDQGSTFVVELPLRTMAKT